MADQQRFRVRFWGVRGSYPTPGPRTLRHGGNTACVEVQAGPHTLILDAGSGIIRLGEEVMRRADGEEHIPLALFITHAHGDHLLGLPFFAPLFSVRTNMHIFGARAADQEIEQLVTPLMSPPYFPIDIRHLPSQRSFHNIIEAQCICWKLGDSNPVVHTQVYGPEHVSDPTEVRVMTQFTQAHPPDGAVIYRIEYDGHSVVYATDVEWHQGCEATFLSFAQDTDLLIHDAQYTTHNYQQTKHGFGHSTVEMATEAARTTHARELILFHHEPTYDDAQLDRMETEAQTRFTHTHSAYEGMEIDLLAYSEDKYNQ